MILHPYYSSSGRNLIYDYIDSLPVKEQVDGYTVLQHMEKGEFDKIFFKPWEKKIYEVYFQKHNRIFYIMKDKENRKIKRKRKTLILCENEQKNLIKCLERNLYDHMRGVTDMPFIQTNIEKDIELKRKNNPEFKKEWDESRAEYKLIEKMISLRKQENITQKELAALTGNKQQVISRIERKESIPTIKAFSHMLDALGYELQIVKKKSI